MKIRYGHVTNSSSSSFIIIGRKVEELEAISLMEQGAEIYVNCGDFSEGENIFKLTPEYLPHMKVAELAGEMAPPEFYQVYQKAYDARGLKLNLDAVKEDARLFEFTADEHSTHDVSEFIDYYNCH